MIAQAAARSFALLQLMPGMIILVPFPSSLGLAKIPSIYQDLPCQLKPVVSEFL